MDTRDGVSPARAGGSANWVRRLILKPPLFVALLTLALYLPSAGRFVQMSPDMVEYTDIAWRMLDGQGYVLGIKAYHVGGREVVHDGLFHRPPLLTLGMASLFWLGLDLHTVQALHTLVGAAAAALVCSIGTILFGRRVGIAAGALAAANPSVFKMQVPLMTEALTCVLILLAVRILVGAGLQPDVRLYLLAGLAFGLAYLARPPALVVLAVTVVVTGLIATDRRRAIRPLAALLAGASLVIVPMSAFSVLRSGRVIYSGKSYLYSVLNDREVIEEGFLRDLPSAAEFISTHFGAIAELIYGLLVTYSRWIFLDWDLLLALLIGWPFAILALWRGAYPRQVWIVLAAAAANFLFYSLTWSTSQDRFLLPTILLLLPVGMDGLFRAVGWALGIVRSWAPFGTALHGRADLVVGVLVSLVVLSWLPQFAEQYRGEFAYFDRRTGTRNDAGIEWTGPPRWVNDGDLKRMLAWAESHSSPNDVLSAGQPWPLGLFSRRPVVMLPVNLDDQSIRRFIVEYRVAELLVDGSDPRRRRYREYLDELTGEGVRSTRLGTVTAFDTRALWR